MGRIREGQEDAAFPVCRWRAYRAGVGVKAGQGVLGVGHRARGEDEWPPPRRRRGDGHPAAAPAVALRQRAVEADGVAGAWWRAGIRALDDGDAMAAIVIARLRRWRGERRTRRSAHGLPVREWSLWRWIIYRL
jgi:hypothetical protein